jgi:hypothetical protein
VRPHGDGYSPTATVEIGGLPSECPNIASESVSDDSGITPRSLKLDTFSLPLSSISEQRFQKIADAIINNPTSQTYILIPADKSVGDAIYARLNRLGLGDYDPPRITYVEMYGDRKIVEVWLVPPGATPPSKCEACQSPEPAKQDCPKISINGPAGFTSPGATMTFTAKADRELPGKPKFEWTVSAGTIESGQGTSTIVVMVPNDFDAGNITTELEVAGLPKGCPNMANELAPVAPRVFGEPVDTYGKLSLFDEYARVQTGVVAAEHDKVSLLLFIRESPRFGQKEKARILALNEFIVNRLRFPKSRYLIINKFGHIYRNTIWIVPPGAKFPE